MISGASSWLSASSAVATTSGASTAIWAPLELGDVFDVLLVLRIGARLGLEPAVEDLAEDGLGSRTQAECEHVRVVPGPCAARGFRVAAKRRADAVDLVGRDRSAGARPAADDSLF